MWQPTESGQFDFSQQQALTTALLMDVLGFISWLLLSCALFAGLSYLIGLACLVCQTNRPAARRGQPAAQKETRPLAVRRRSLRLAPTRKTPTPINRI